MVVILYIQLPGVEVLLNDLRCGAVAVNRFSHWGRISLSVV